VAVLAPMCADKFRNGSDAVLKMAEFKTVNSWQQDSYNSEERLGHVPGMSRRTSPLPRPVPSCCRRLTRAREHMRAKRRAKRNALPC